MRGYRENDLGPKDTFGRPYGGDLLTAGQVELLLPIPEKWEAKSRFTLFFDMGNVFSVGDVVFYDKFGSQNGNGQRIDYGFDASNLKRSYGISAQWLAPLGLFRFSYAFPMDANDGTTTLWGDKTERFQFSIGGAF